MKLGYEFFVRADVAEAADPLEANRFAEAVVVSDPVIAASLDVTCCEIHRRDGSILIDSGATAKEKITQPIDQLGVDLLGNHLAGTTNNRVKPAFKEVLHIEERVL